MLMINNNVMSSLSDPNYGLHDTDVDNWDNHITKFKKITPRDYEKALFKLNKKHEVFIN